MITIRLNNCIFHKKQFDRVRTRFRAIRAHGPPEPPSPDDDIILGSILLAGAFAVSQRIHAPVKCIEQHNLSGTPTKIVTVKNREDFSKGVADMPFPTCDIGTLGGLVPMTWGLPYNGENPGVALVMATAGVTIRMIINIWIMYLIYTWLNGVHDDNDGK